MENNSFLFVVLVDILEFSSQNLHGRIPKSEIKVLPVVEESQSLMGPDSDKSFHWQRFQWSQCLAYTSHPPGHLTRTVDVVRLHVLGEVLL